MFNGLHFLMDRNELTVTARLALLDVSGDEMERLEVEVGRMLDYFSQMKDLEIEEPSAAGGPVAENQLREDLVRPTHEKKGADTLLENAPEREDRFISIPNVL